MLTKRTHFQTLWKHCECGRLLYLDRQITGASEVSLESTLGSQLRSWKILQQGKALQVSCTLERISRSLAPKAMLLTDPFV
jgi:hypothetical protein